MIAGLVAPSCEVDHADLITTDEVWNEIRDAFPLTLFTHWADTHPPIDDADQYDDNLEP